MLIKFWLISNLIFLKQVDITGLFNHEDLSKIVSQAVSDLLPETLEEYQEEVTAEVNKVSLVVGNKILANYTIGSFPTLKYVNLV